MHDGRCAIEPHPSRASSSACPDHRRSRCRATESGPRMSLSTLHFDVDVLAQSSIVHREDYSSVGTDNFALFRREKIITPDGEVMQIPIVSSSSFRGVLRRIGEALTAGVLDYEGAALPIPAAPAHQRRSARQIRASPHRRRRTPPQNPRASDRRLRRRGLRPHHVRAPHRRQGPPRDRRTRPHTAPPTTDHPATRRARRRRGIV